MDHPEVRRSSTRVGIDGFCSEIVEGRERHGYVVDLSELGLRVERPFLPGPTPRELQLELELPDLDEIIWARGAIRFDQIRRARGTGAILRSTGIRILAAASRDLRLIRDFVIERRRARESIDQSIAWSTAFALG